MPLPGFHSPVDQPAYGSPPSDKLFAIRAGLSTEVALCNASEILESAAVSAYDCAEHLDGASRKQVLAVVQWVEMAQLLVDEALDRECPVA
ncbi:DUF6124 family protein [Pseudomonas yamanorum]|uniref:DUF3077 domain-containing protein n=2 Tax=Pseudomonas yamanorum TaxID=515393 RepID=A0A7Y8EEJ8_9PSED|nr:DUF3077 domain-containing protein [Pseudomonas yamanorum]